VVAKPQRLKVSICVRSYVIATLFIGFYGFDLGRLFKQKSKVVVSFNLLALAISIKLNKKELPLKLHSDDWEKANSLFYMELYLTEIMRNLRLCRIGPNGAKYAYLQISCDL
jgi:hypothetical protein